MISYGKLTIFLAIGMICMMSVSEGNPQGPPQPPPGGSGPGGMQGMASGVINGMKMAADMPAKMWEAGTAAMAGGANMAVSGAGKKK